MKSIYPLKKKRFEVYEHLEHYVKKTTYAHRLQWLQDINEFIWLSKKKKIIPPRSTK
ncbi:MAG: hypothetical protein HY209_03420 [Candidatus Omnitrophica bacterium]|nr:hypothetical protein [Candidatus Omnitrophota bacterium]